MQSSVNLIMNKHSTKVIHQNGADVTFDVITFFDAWPAYKISEMIFCSKFILGCLYLRMIAAHTPTMAFVFGLATLVFVQACRNESRVGVLLDNSE